MLSPTTPSASLEERALRTARRIPAGGLCDREHPPAIRFRCGPQDAERRLHRDVLQIAPSSLATGMTKALLVAAMAVALGTWATAAHASVITVGDIMITTLVGGARRDRRGRDEHSRR